MTTSLNKHYRRIWHENHGEIPRDENGISYEIHHINGDHHDNRIQNLQCISIHEHYMIHYELGDMYVCSSILQRLKRHVNASSLDRLQKSMPLKGSAHPMFGKKQSTKSRQKISENHADVSGNKNPMFGKKHSGEAKQRISAANKGRPAPPFTTESHRRISESKYEYWKTKGKARIRKIEVDGVIYENAFKASEAFGIQPVNVRRRCRLERYKNWGYIENSNP